MSSENKKFKFQSGGSETVNHLEDETTKKKYIAELKSPSGSEAKIKQMSFSR